jgi:hypothetical protein
LTAKEKEEENTSISENYHMTTPRIEEQSEEEEDEFHSFENYSLRGSSWMEHRFMTPNTRPKIEDPLQSEEQQKEDSRGEGKKRHQFALNIPNWNNSANSSKREANRNIF